MKNLTALKAELARLETLGNEQKQLITDDIEGIKSKFFLPEAAAAELAPHTVKDIFMQSGGLEFVLTLLIDKVLLGGPVSWGKGLAGFALKSLVTNKSAMGFLKNTLNRLTNRNARSQHSIKEGEINSYEEGNRYSS